MNICNKDRVGNMVNVYLAHMIGLDMTKFITQYQYVVMERNLTHYPFFQGKAYFKTYLLPYIIETFLWIG